jgi:hypothetical protein
LEAYEEAIARTSTKQAPWFVIPSNHKWFRNLAISQIIADTMEDMGLQLPPPHVDIADIRRKCHVAEHDPRGKNEKGTPRSKSRLQRRVVDVGLAKAGGA